MMTDWVTNYVHCRYFDTQTTVTVALVPDDFHDNFIDPWANL